MIYKFFGGFGEVQEQPVGMFALIVIILCHRSGAQEFVEESVAVLPWIPVFQNRDIPGTKAHAYPQSDGAK